MKSPGRPAEFFNYVLAEYVTELITAGTKWAVVEIEANKFLAECERKPLSMSRLKQLHKKYRGTEWTPGMHRQPVDPGAEVPRTFDEIAQEVYRRRKKR